MEPIPRKKKRLRIKCRPERGNYIINTRRRSNVPESQKITSSSKIDLVGRGEIRVVANAAILRIDVVRFTSFATGSRSLGLLLEVLEPAPAELPRLDTAVRQPCGQLCSHAAATC